MDALIQKISTGSHLAIFSRFTESVYPKRLNTPLLPEDVIEIILDHLFPDIPFSSPEFSWNSRDSDAGYTKRYMASLCFSRAWVNPVRRVLYRTITQYYNTPAKSPLLWNAIWTTPHIRNFVRRLHLMELVGGRPVLLTDINALLPRCSVLLSLPAFGRLTPETVVSSNSIGYFSASWTALGSYSTELWRTAFRNWTRLESLQIEGNPTWFPCNDHLTNDGAYLPSLRMLSFKALRAERIPIPPTTPNTLHTISISNCLINDTAPFLILILRHSESLRRLYIGYTSGAGSEMLTELLPHLRGLETLIIQDSGVILSDNVFLHLPLSLVKISFRIRIWVDAPLLFGAFQTFILSETIKPRLRMTEISFTMGESTRARIDERWTLFARHNMRQDVRILFPKRGEDEDLPKWARLDDEL